MSTATVYRYLGCSAILTIILGCSDNDTDNAILNGAGGQQTNDSAGGRAASAGGSQNNSPTGGYLNAAAAGGSAATPITGGSAAIGGSSATTAAAGHPGTGGAQATGGLQFATGGQMVTTTPSQGATGGAPGTGGIASTGGTSVTGGSPGAGGSAVTGGSEATGGMQAATGGAHSPATSGDPGTGGTFATGGTLATGGDPGTGGTFATGGDQGTGGTLATGGDQGVGGVAAAGGSEAGTGGDQGTGATSPSHQTVTRSTYVLAGDPCAYGGERVESGLDSDDNGQLSDNEVDSSATVVNCYPSAAWREADPLPGVQTAYSFSLAEGPDGTPHLGLMFLDATYRQTLIDGGTLWNGGGVYNGDQVLAIYRLAGSANLTWTAYQGRTTPQYYQFSELFFNGDDSYYTTNYAAFGGLVSVVRNGQSGAYALTSAYSGRRAHTIAFLDDDLYALVAQKNTGLTLSVIPAASVGTTLSNIWTNRVVITTNATGVSDPNLLNASGTLVAGYINAGQAVIRATATPSALAVEADFTVIGGCDDAVDLSLAWDGTLLYRACVGSNGTLSIASTDLARLPISWNEIPIHVTGSVSSVDLSASIGNVGFACRQQNAIRVFGELTDPQPSFDAVLPGSFDFIATAHGLALSVCDLASSPTTLRTFVP